LTERRIRVSDQLVERQAMLVHNSCIDYGLLYLEDYDR